MWLRQKVVGHPAAIVDFSRVASPLLAGFALAAAISLVSSANDIGTRGELAVLAFATSACSLIFAVQAGLTASRFQTTPDQRLSWYPEMRQFDYWILLVRQQQWTEEEVAEKYRRILFVTYNFGIVAFLLGLFCALMPAPGQWTGVRVFAMVIVGAVTAIEIIGILNIKFLGSGVLFPSLKQSLPGFPDKPNINPAMPAMKPDEIRRVLFGESVPPASRPPTDDGPTTETANTQRLLRLAAEALTKERELSAHRARQSPQDQG